MNQVEYEKAIVNREAFEYYLNGLAKVCGSGIDKVEVCWDDKDIQFMETHDYVTVTYLNGYNKKIDTTANSLQATALEVLRRI